MTKALFQVMVFSNGLEAGHFDEIVGPFADQSEVIRFLEDIQDKGGDTLAMDAGQVEAEEDSTFTVVFCDYDHRLFKVTAHATELDAANFVERLDEKDADGVFFNPIAAFADIESTRVEKVVAPRSFFFGA